MLSRRGQFDEAEELHRQTLALCQTDMEKMISMNNLAGVLVGQGRYDEAESLLQNVVKLSTEALGRDSCKIRSSMRKIADVLTRNGKYKEVEDILRDVLVTGVA